MNGHNRVFNSLISGEALPASFIGLLLITRPVVKGNALRL